MMETRRGRGPSRLQIVLVVILVIIAVITVGLTLFQIKNVQVIGNERYSSDQIISDLVYDFPTRNSLYLGWKYRSARTESRTPYLNTVQVKMTSPGNVQIIVQERTLYGYVEYGGQKHFFDQDGIVLETSTEAAAGTILITGVAMEEPELYKKLPVENTAQLRTMLSVTKLLRETQMDVSEISFDENQNITARIGTIDVLLGQDEYMEEKISNLEAIYRLQEGQTGVLNMSAYTGKNEPITFSSSDSSSAADEAAEEAGSGETNEGEGQPDAAEDDFNTDLSQGAAMEDAADDAADVPSAEENASGGEVTGIEGFMVFDSSGTLRYDARVIAGQVLDAYGSPIDGCYVNEDGYVVDAYMNVIDPMTGTLAAQ